MFTQSLAYAHNTRIHRGANISPHSLVFSWRLSGLLLLTASAYLPEDRLDTTPPQKMRSKSQEQSVATRSKINAHAAGFWNDTSVAMTDFYERHQLLSQITTSSSVTLHYRQKVTIIPKQWQIDATTDYNVDICTIQNDHSTLKEDSSRRLRNITDSFAWPSDPRTGLGKNQASTRFGQYKKASSVRRRASQWNHIERWG